MKQINLLENVSTLTKIPLNILYTITKTAEKDICHCLYEEFILSDKTFISYDIGFGSLYITYNVDDESVSYEFIPNKKFEKDVINTLNNKEDILVKDIELNLKNKVLSLYKELV